MNVTHYHRQKRGAVPVTVAQVLKVQHSMDSMHAWTAYGILYKKTPKGHLNHSYTIYISA